MALELVGQVKDVAGDAAGVGQVIGAYEQDSQLGRVRFRLYWR